MNDTTDSTVTPQRLAILWQDIIIAGCRTLLDMADDDTLDGPPGGPRRLSRYLSPDHLGRVAL